VKLPKADTVRIDEAKVRDYLLSKSHPVGRFKARVFAAVGFDEATASEFVRQIRSIGDAGEVLSFEDTEFGRKYTVPGSLVGAKGTLAVLTVWIQEPRREDVRLVTVLPRSS
jgi:hypothetical protein